MKIPRAISPPFLLCTWALVAAPSCRRAADSSACAADAGARLAIHLYAQPVIAEGLPASAEPRLAHAVSMFAVCAGAHIELYPIARQPLSIPFPLRHDELARLDQAAARAALTQPLARILTSAAPPTPSTIALIVLPDIAPSDSAASYELPELTGLGIPSVLADDSTLAPWAAALPKSHAPAVLLSWARWSRLDENEAATSLGHEIGHALSLAHDARAGNLMNPETRARFWISQEQVAGIRSASKDLASRR